MNVDQIIAEVRAEIGRLEQVLSLLGATSKKSSSGKEKNTAGASRRISAAGRRRIAAAQRARWAKVRAGK